MESETPCKLHQPKSISGYQLFNLICQDYGEPYYLTYLQCKKKGGHIHKGEQGLPIVFWDIRSKKPVSEDDEPESYPVFKYSIVFNIEQTNLIAAEAAGSETDNLAIRQILENLIDQPIIKHNPAKAYYSPDGDYISIPPKNNFYSEEEYYSTLLHELVHWTGHTGRLNRTYGGLQRYAYAYEELVAEIGSAFLCGTVGITQQTIDNQAAYIAGWLDLIHEEKDALLKAAGDAQKAVGYIISHKN